MDGLQGVVLSVKLKHLPAWTDARRRTAQYYDDLLSRVDGVVCPAEADYARHVYHLYVVRVQNRDALLSSLGEKGIACGIHYPIPLHLTEAYQYLGYKEGAFAVAEKCAVEYPSLPMFPELTADYG